MRALIQRSGPANCKVDGQITGQIKSGMVVFLGIKTGDSEVEIKKIVEKIINLRIFTSEEKNFEKSLLETGQEVLLISQFTLYASCKKGRRPDFGHSAAPEIAKPIYEKFILELQNLNIPVQTGIFGANMNILLENQGPVTIFLDTENL